MFSVAEKRWIAERVEELLLGLRHPEMPSERPFFRLHVEGKEGWSWANIGPNWQHDDSELQNVNPWNKRAREIMGEDHAEDQ